jgi:hypothetical protein
LGKRLPKLTCIFRRCRAYGKKRKSFIVGPMPLCPRCRNLDKWNSDAY